MGSRWRCKKREVGEMVQTSLEEKGATENEMVRWHHRLNGIIDSPLTPVSLSKLWEIAKDREAWRAAVHGVTKRWTRLSD